MATKRFMKS